MHDKYAAVWYKTLTFSQTTTITLANGGTLVQQWLEAGKFPGRLRIDTDTPGFTVQVWARNTPPQPNTPDFNQPGGWVQLASQPYVHHKQDIGLPGAAPYRYYLVWVVSLPPGLQSVSLNEISLYK